VPDGAKRQRQRIEEKKKRKIVKIMVQQNVETRAIPSFILIQKRKGHQCNFDKIDKPLSGLSLAYPRYPITLD